MSNYRVAPIFLIRMAGVPFEAMEALATVESSRLARELLVRKRARAEAATEAERFFSSRERLLSPAAYHALRVAVRTERAPAAVPGDQPPVFSHYATAAADVDKLEAELINTLHRECAHARAALIRGSREFLPRYLLFGAEGVRSLLARQLDAYPFDLTTLPPRNNPARKVEQTLLLYLQRVAAKNDTFSEFGPAAWGQASAEVDGLQLSPLPRIARREVFLERWTAHTAAAAMNADADVFPELSPRLNPAGRLRAENFTFTDTGETIPLTPREQTLLQQCDGQTPTHHLASDDAEIRSLVAKNVLRCCIEVPAMEAHAFATLTADVEGWRPGPAREKWLNILQPISDLPRQFATSTATDQRQQILDEARARLEQIGGMPSNGGRFLYSAVNPIGEECFRESNCVIEEKLIDEVAVTAAPWLDLWRDSYAFVASRVAAGLRQVFRQTAPSATAIPLPQFLRACEEAKLALTGPGLVVLATIAFEEVKAAFAARLRPHLEADEYELTADDCHIVRQSFDYPKFEEYTYPSADLQLAAASPEAIRRSDYRWIIGELHPPVALMHHGFYWSCPDHPALNHALASTTFGKPSAHFGFFAADFASHTTVRLFDALPELANFVAAQRANPAWRSVSPAEVEVSIDPATNDVCLRRSETHEPLGSFARAWLIPLGFHPFSFSLAPQTPRLRCGNVVVQRRSWTLTLGELGPHEFTGISRELVLAVEELRAARGLPRFLFVRPTEQALRRSGAVGRDKDTKPVFIDLESYLSLEIFQRWLQKAGELEATEMLPAPEHLCWHDIDGRRTFELRTLIVPRS